jgi:transcriptional regulator with XRE-family HTH domain
MESKGKRLKIIRTMKGFDQREMSAKIDVQQGSYSKMENDKLGISEEAIVGLVNMGININWLFTGEGEMLLSQNLAPTPSDECEPEALMEEMEERVRRIRIDVSDIEDTLKKMLGRRRK